MKSDSLEWQKDAACIDKDPELFFYRSQREGYLAKEVCRQCDVQIQCLQYALENNEIYGVWGGKNEFERAEIKRQKRSRK